MSDINYPPNIREAHPSETIIPATYIFRRTFMSQEHNYLCAVCREKPAVIETWRGVLQPCWSCQNDGYYLDKSWWNKLRRRLWIDCESCEAERELFADLDEHDPRPQEGVSEEGEG